MPNPKNKKIKKEEKTIREGIEEYLNNQGIKMYKKISSGGFLAEATYDYRTAYSLDEVVKLTKEGFSVDSDIGAILWNVLIYY